MTTRNIKQCIEILRNAKSIDDLLTVRNIFVSEKMINGDLDNAIRSHQQGNIEAMTLFIFGPSPITGGPGLMSFLEQQLRYNDARGIV
jgi:hypothetical protein